MPKPGGQLHLPLEASLGRHRGKRAGQQDLQGHDPLGGHLKCLVDYTHPSPALLLVQLVAFDRRKSPGRRDRLDGRLQVGRAGANLVQKRQPLQVGL